MKLFKLFKVPLKHFSNFITTSLYAYLIPFAIFALFEQFILKNSTTDNSRIIYGLVGVTLSFLVFIYLFIALGYPHMGQEKSFFSQVKEKYRDLLIENLRGLGYVMMGLILFWTLPRRISQYILINYVVIFDPRYARGEIDIFEETQRLTTGNILLILGTLILTQSVVWGIDITALNYNIFTSLGIWILIFTLEVFITVYVFNIYLNLYNHLSAIKGEN